MNFIKDGKSSNSLYISKYFIDIKIEKNITSFLVLALYGLFHWNTIIDNVISIIVKEYCTTINYPKERIQEYKAVINAAADFNKKVMIIEKK